MYTGILETQQTSEILEDAVLSSFSSSSSLSFSQGYHTIIQRNPLPGLQLRTTPTVHSITQFPPVLRWVSSPDEFTNVDGYRDS